MSPIIERIVFDLHAADFDDATIPKPGDRYYSMAKAVAPTIEALQAENERLTKLLGEAREGLERAAGDCDLAHSALGNSGPEFLSVMKGFIIVRDRVRATLSRLSEKEAGE